MTLQLFDSATRELRELVPITPGRIGLYVCGATVQGAPHIGHLRTDVAFDVLVRWLQRKGLQVTLVRNVTDIDDKILAKSAEAEVDWWAWAMRHERAFANAREALKVLPASYEPRATGHVTEMVEMMDRLVERGHAYSTGPGDVWFDVRSWPQYGSLTNQRPDDIGASDDDAGQKRDPRDFALWKAAKPGEPTTASWPTPWGAGRPGWHLECSAMARRYLGDEFDIHGGGIDLRFPHHENEQAQSRAAGHGFARMWLHTAWVSMAGEKMSKSLGNTALVHTLLKSTDPGVLRYALTSVHYRSVLEWSQDSVTEAAATWSRLAGFVRRGAEHYGALVTGPVTEVELPDAFTEAMDDDLNVSAALAVVHDHTHRGNIALADGDPDAAQEVLTVRAMLDVLGLDPLVWQTGSSGRADSALEALIRAELDVRAQARAAHDWAAADAVRDKLAAAGIVVEDSPTGARWNLVEES